MQCLNVVSCLDAQVRFIDFRIMYTLESDTVRFPSQVCCSLYGTTRRSTRPSSICGMRGSGWIPIRSLRCALGLLDQLHQLIVGPAASEASFVSGNRWTWSQFIVVHAGDVALDRFHRSLFGPVPSDASSSMHPEICTFSFAKFLGFC